MFKICWISNIPSPYKVNVMKLMSEELEIHALFERRKENDREDSWYSSDFGNVKVQYLDKNYKKVIDKEVNTCDLLINADYSNKMCIYATHKFNKYKKPVIMLADGGLVIKRGILDYIISYFMNKCNYFLSSGKEVNKYYKYYNVDENKIFNYRFSSLTKSDLKNNESLIRNKSELRKKHNIGEEIILFSVGQQINRKGYDILVKSMIKVNKKIKLYIAGGKPQEEVLKIINDNNLDNINFVGFKNKEELNEYYAMADIFVFPTRYDIWGLVINEAMSFGLPIISSDKCVAAIEFNNNFNNAIIVENENVEEFAKAINLLVENDDLKTELSKKSLLGIKEYTIENTVSDFVRVISEVLNHGQN